MKLLKTLDPLASGRPITILYVRLSSEEQANGSGLDRQLAAVKLWCMQEQITEAILLEDVGLSAFVGAHITKGKMGELLNAAKAGRIAQGSVLVMENLDRLSRDNPLEAIQILIDFLNRGIDVVTTTDRNRYSRSGNSTQAMTTLVLGALHFGRSNSESELKSSRVSDAWTIKIEQARSSLAPHGKRCPAWIRLGPNGYEPIDERVREVKWMFAQAIAGKGRRQIVKGLVDREVPPWTEPSEKRPVPAWSDSYIQKILTGCEAYGTYRPSRTPKRGPKVFLDPIPGYYPAAVSYEVAASARASAAPRHGSGGRKGKFVNLFQGLCVCAACGKGMTLENKGRRSSGPKLICQRATLANCDHRFRYDYAFLEPSVIFVVRQRADALLAASRSEVEELGSILDRRKIRLEAVTSGMGRLAKQMELVDDDGTLTRNFMTLRAEQREILAEIESLELKSASTRTAADAHTLPSLLDFYRRLREVEPKDRPSARNAVNQGLRHVIDRIYFEDGQVTVKLRGGGTGKIAARPATTRKPNPGHFTARRDRGGKQLRRGRESTSRT